MKVFALPVTPGKANIVLGQSEYPYSISDNLELTLIKSKKNFTSL